MQKEKMTIQQLWTAYQKLCVPHDANSTQVTETRKAFFAGFISMFEINVLIGSPKVSEEAGVNMLEGYRNEIAEYLRIVGAQEHDRRYSN